MQTSISKCIEKNELIKYAIPKRGKTKACMNSVKGGLNATETSENMWTESWLQACTETRVASHASES